MQYPSESDLEACLRTISADLGDINPAPVRISMVRLHGKPPMYAVVILSASKEPMRQRLGRVLSRNFSLGVTSIMLSVDEVEALRAHCETIARREARPA
jgi:hypothetical protein